MCNYISYYFVQERIVDFVVRSAKPWALLMPNYVATKAYFFSAINGEKKKLVSPQRAGHPFFIVPTLSLEAGRRKLARYQFTHPDGTGHSDSPFDSFWFIDIAEPPGVGAVHSDRETIARCVGEALARASASAVVVGSVDELRSCGFVPTSKRLNPKQRKRAKQLKLLSDI